MIYMIIFQSILPNSDELDILYEIEKPFFSGCLKKK